MTKEELVESVISGSISISRIGEHTDDISAVEVRRTAVARLTRTKLQCLGALQIHEDVARKRAENVIGAVAVPLGVVGPLRVLGSHTNGSFYVPMATTEGALIASAGRGVKAVTASGGAVARVLYDGMTRAPLFACDSHESRRLLLDWVESEHDRIAQVAEATSNHAQLVSITPFIVGNNVWLRFEYLTGDAMGMNMVTIATQEAVNLIVSKVAGVRCVAITGNICSDKKESSVNTLLGRGKSVVAEVTVPAEVLTGTLRTTAADVSDLNARKNLLGSALAGSGKFNTHFANIVAAIFLATGQDIAQVVESSGGFTWVEARGDDLYFSITLPSLEVGTVGGGTDLSAQREALALLGVAGSGDPIGSNAKRFAEIVAATVLAGELGTLCAVATGEVATAHRRMARGASS